jgi:hypothetical protein
MAKVNLDAAPVPTVKCERCEFIASALPEPIVLFLRPLTSVMWDQWKVKCAEYEAKYVDGGWHDEDGKYQEKPTVFIDGSGMIPTVWPLNSETLGNIAKIELMQSSAPIEDRYNFDDLVKIAHKFDDVWDQIRVKAYLIQESYKPGKGWPVPSEKPMKSSSETDSEA